VSQDLVGSKTDRTRQEIVAAAIRCWSSDNTASLGAVADSAGVGRTTLNRYFSDRTALIAAVDLECRRRFDEAARRARPEEGPGLLALQRIAVEIMQLGEVLGVIFADNAVVDPDTWYDPEQGHPLNQVVLRGQADGSLAADLPPQWLITVVWTSLFAGWLMIKEGNLTWYEVAKLLERTLTSGISPT
jgi:AcrR family transcriptional regulator